MSRQKIRELGLSVGVLPTSMKNCITDVKGVRVGHKTIHFPLPNGEYSCTGVTAILPHGGNIFREKVVATSYVFNGFGKTTGLIQLTELGRLESPIMLTNTFSVPAVTIGTLRYLLEENEEIGQTTGTVNVVVGECNDSYLNDIRSFSVQPEHAEYAIRSATSNRVTEGAVGAGTGMVCFDYKGGIGCSSRKIAKKEMEQAYTVGCLVLSNYGEREELFGHRFSFDQTITPKNSDGSIIIVLATDAPLNERQLQRVAKRCGIGLGRTGSHMSHGSGDIVIAFSTAQTFSHADEAIMEQITQLKEDKQIMNTLFTAAAEVTEEAILNAMSRAVLTKGRKGRVVNEIPYNILKQLIE